MTLGLPLTQTDINVKAASLAIDLINALAACKRFKTELLDNTNIIANDAALVAMGFTAGEVTTLRAAFAAASKLSDIANALDVQTPASNFLVDLRKLRGAVV